jgi:hypothetical protein
VKKKQITQIGKIAINQKLTGIVIILECKIRLKVLVEENF